MLLQGTGGVAIFGLQFARLAGARTIVLTGNDSQIPTVEALGVTTVINDRAVRQWSEAVLAATDGTGVGHVLELGGPASFAQSVASLRPGGRAAGRPGGQTNAIGYLGGKDGGVNPLDFFRKRVTICGIPVGHRASFEAMNRAIAGTQMKPVIDRSFHWSEIETALAHLASGQHVGKVAPVMN